MGKDEPVTCTSTTFKLPTLNRPEPAKLSVLALTIATQLTGYSLLQWRLSSLECSRRPVTTILYFYNIYIKKNDNNTLQDEF